MDQADRSPPGLEMTVRLQPRHAMVFPEGELDLATVDQFEDALSVAGRGRPRMLVVDLRGLTFMDSAGLQALLAARERCRAAGARLVLVRGRGAVQRVLEVSGIDRWFEFVGPKEVAYMEASVEKLSTRRVRGEQTRESGRSS